MLRKRSIRRSRSAHPADAACVTLVQTHHAIIERVVRQYARWHADRDELQQEILAQLWRALPSFAGRATLSTWVYRVALNITSVAQLYDR